MIHLIYIKRKVVGWSKLINISELLSLVIDRLLAGIINQGFKNPHNTISRNLQEKYNVISNKRSCI